MAQLLPQQALLIKLTKYFLWARPPSEIFPYLIITDNRIVQISRNHVQIANAKLSIAGLVKRLNELNSLSDPDRDGILYALDGLLRDAKARKAYAH